MECPDFSEFQESLKNLRRVDDIIINTLNGVIPTDSFNPDAAKACRELHGQLKDSYSQRKDSIKRCISVSADKIRQLKERQDAENSNLIKNIKAEQTKLKMLRVELSVEDLIEERSAKVFNERCRKYYKP